VTAADVKKVAAKYFDLQSSVTGFLIPQDAAAQESPPRPEARQ
jgi:hypothetical protein